MCWKLYSWRDPLTYKCQKCQGCIYSVLLYISAEYQRKISSCFWHSEGKIVDLNITINKLIELAPINYFLQQQKITHFLKNIWNIQEQSTFWAIKDTFTNLKEKKSYSLGSRTTVELSRKSEPDSCKRKEKKDIQTAREDTKTVFVHRWHDHLFTKSKNINNSKLLEQRNDCSRVAGYKISVASQWLSYKPVINKWNLKLNTLPFTITNYHLYLQKWNI